MEVGAGCGLGCGIVSLLTPFGCLSSTFGWCWKGFYSIRFTKTTTESSMTNSRYGGTHDARRRRLTQILGGRITGDDVLGDLLRDINTGLDTESLEGQVLEWPLEEFSG